MHIFYAIIKIIIEKMRSSVFLEYVHKKVLVNLLMILNKLMYAQLKVCNYPGNPIGLSKKIYRPWHVSSIGYMYTCII